MKTVTKLTLLGLALAVVVGCGGSSASTSSSGTSGYAPNPDSKAPNQEMGGTRKVGPAQ